MVLAPSAQQGAGLEIEQPEHKPATLCDAGITSVTLTDYATTLVPKFHLSFVDFPANNDCSVGAGSWLSQQHQRPFHE